MYTFCTNNNGGKITIKDIYKDGKYRTEDGLNIDILYPANSLINRSISGALYEVHLNSVGMFIENTVRANLITKEDLYNTMNKLYSIIGKGENFLKEVELSPEDLFNGIKIHGVKWCVRPYDEDVTIQTMSKFTAICQDVFGFKKHKIFTNDIEASDPLVVGKMFMMRLQHDRMHTVAGSSIPRKDSRGHIVDKSTTKKDGRSLHGDKPTKMCILTMDKLLKTLSNESMYVMLKEKDPLFGTHQLSEAVGFKFEATKRVLNRMELEEEEID
ncbi:MAG: hypothetical protein ACRCX8_12560 [Sarcina sp.]